MAKEMRTADATWLDLQKPGKFEEFFSAFLKHLKKRLQIIEVKGKVEYSYYSCGEVMIQGIRIGNPGDILNAFVRKLALMI